jgi:hypothetical protein
MFPLLKQLQKGGAKKEESMLSYCITITMEMVKGDTITDQEIKKCKCRQKLNSVRKSYAKITNKKYVIPPVYDNNGSSDKKNKQNKTAKNRK